MASRFHGVAWAAMLLVSMLSVYGMGTADAVTAATPACSVRNTTTSVHFTNLKTAITAAAAGTTLSVTGTCVGPFTISKNLTIQKGSSAAVLKASGARVLMVTGGVVTLNGLQITGGSATDCPAYGGWLCGGGMYNTATLKLIGTVVSSNKADSTGLTASYGGGIYNAVGATMTLTRSTVSGNTSSSERFGEGGGIANDGTLTLTQSTVSGNTASGTAASYAGGIYNYNGATLTLTASTVSGNTASSPGGAYGGGIYNDDVLTVTNSTLTANRVVGSTSTGYGGGIYNYSSNLTVKGSTIARNTVTGSTATGGGIYSDGQPTISSTIIALNAAHSSGRDCSIYHSYDTVIGSYNLVGTGSGCTVTNGTNHDIVGTNANPVDPKLGALAANGGPTETLALLNGSVAIGKAGKKPCNTPIDQRGTARPQGTACDIGAFERP